MRTWKQSKKITIEFATKLQPKKLLPVNSGTIDILSGTIDILSGTIDILSQGIPATSVISRLSEGDKDKKSKMAVHGSRWQFMAVTFL